MREKKWAEEDKEAERIRASKRTPSPPAAAPWYDNPVTPKSVKPFQRQADFLLGAPLMPTTCGCLLTFVKGTISMANTDLLLEEKLGQTQAAENARVTRKIKAWRTTQQGGHVYASEGRQMAKTREESDLAKAPALIRRKAGKAEKRKREEEARQPGEEIEDGHILADISCNQQHLEALTKNTRTNREPIERVSHYFFWKEQRDKEKRHKEVQDYSRKCAAKKNNIRCKGV
jgi:hypothetical protein